MSGWQLIESAPRDGTRVDLWVHWPERDLTYRVPDAYWNGRCWQLGAFDETQFLYRPTVTHWQSLPTPPYRSDPTMTDPHELADRLARLAEKANLSIWFAGPLCGEEEHRMISVGGYNLSDRPLREHHYEDTILEVWDNPNNTSDVEATAALLCELINNLPTILSALRIPATSSPYTGYPPSAFDPISDTPASDREARAFELLVDLQSALVLTREHNPFISVKAFVDGSNKYDRVSKYLHASQYAHQVLSAAEQRGFERAREMAADPETVNRVARALFCIDEGWESLDQLHGKTIDYWFRCTEDNGREDAGCYRQCEDHRKNARFILAAINPERTEP